MKEHIKYCPRCASQELDLTTFDSDGGAVCLLCKTQFAVVVVRLDNQPRATERPVVDAYRTTPAREEP